MARVCFYPKPTGTQSHRSVEDLELLVKIRFSAGLQSPSSCSGLWDNPANLQCCCRTEAETGFVPTSAQTFAVHVRDGICVDPPLCRGPSQGIHGLGFTVLVCEGETVGQIGVVEKGERELVLVVSVRCGKE